MRASVPCPRGCREARAASAKRRGLPDRYVIDALAAPVAWLDAAMAVVEPRPFELAFGGFFRFLLARQLG